MAYPARGLGQHPPGVDGVGWPDLGVYPEQSPAPGSGTAHKLRSRKDLGGSGTRTWRRMQTTRSGWRLPKDSSAMRRTLWRTPAPLEDVYSHVQSLVQDKRGGLWLASSDFLARLSSNQVTTVKWPEGMEGTFEAHDALFSLPDGRLVIAASARAYLFEPDHSLFHTVRHPSGHPLRFAGQLPDGAVVVEPLTAEAGAASPSPLERFDGDTFQPFLSAPADWSFGPLISAVTASSNGDIWLGGAVAPHGGGMENLNCSAPPRASAPGRSAASRISAAAGSGAPIPGVFWSSPVRTGRCCAQALTASTRSCVGLTRRSGSGRPTVCTVSRTGRGCSTAWRKVCPARAFRASWSTLSASSGRAQLAGPRATIRTPTRSLRKPFLQSSRIRATATSPVIEPPSS